MSTPSILLLTGYTPEEWIGSRLQDHCDEGHYTAMCRVVADAIESGSPPSGVIFESVLLRKNRPPVPVEIHGKLT